MSRKPLTKKIRHISDVIYNNYFIGRLINTIMRSGKKTIAEKIVYGVIDQYAAKYAIAKEEAVSRIEDAFCKVKPTLEVKSKRVGGATLSIPVDVRPTKATSLAIRWIQDAFLVRKEKTASLRLFHEILDIEAGKSASLTKKENVHKMAESNKVYAHYK